MSGEGKVYYAIGDVHGLADRLAALHDLIDADIARHGAPAAIIHIGDLVDRGPDSAQCIERAMALEKIATERLEVITLLGNHEKMMLDAVRTGEAPHARQWLQNGGDRALDSYRRFTARDGREAVPEAHLAWIEGLNTLHYVPERKLAFVHAGIDPAVFPLCPDEIRIWTRSEKFFNPQRWPKRPELQGLTVVHGHTPTQNLKPFVHPQRINVDSGAVYGGPLTCVVLAPAEAPRFLSA